MMLRKWGAGVLLSLVILLFAAATCFVIPSPSKYHGDEKFYTDAALRMCAADDYWTPQYSSGRIRLLKPILAYWPIVASFKTFGVSLATSRLPAVLAGALSLVCVFWLGRVVFKSDRIAVLASVLLASNVEFLTLSARATPDALVTAFCAVSMLGFAMVWFGEARWQTGAFLAWCGIGLAVQTKGLLGLSPLAANLLFAVMAKPEDWRARARALSGWLPVLTGLALATFWYVVMLRLHGAGALRSFFDDQVGAKVSLSPVTVLLNFGTYFLAGLRHSLPWTLLLAAAAILNRKTFLRFWTRHRAACIFLVVLFLLLVLGFSFGNMRRSRYMTVSYPALALLFAAALCEFWENVRLQKIVGQIMMILGIVLNAFSAALFIWGGWLGWRLAAASVALAAVGIAGIWLARRHNAFARWCWIGVLMALFYAVFDGAIRTVSTPSPLPGLAQRLMLLNPPQKEIVTFKIEESAAALLRLNTHGKLIIRPLREEDAARPAPVLITTRQGRESPLLENYKFESAGLAPEAVRVRDALQKFRFSKRGRNSSRRDVEYFIGAPMRY